MGCILCPDPAGIEEKVSLLEKGEKVLFYKRKNGEEVRYSRQATEGICQNAFYVLYLIRMNF